jgi:hypothetical protein
VIRSAATASGLDRDVNKICHQLGNELNYTIPKITAEGFYQTRNTIVLQLKISVAGWSHKNLPK